MENNVFIICQEKAEVIRMIFDYYLSGASLGKVVPLNIRVEFDAIKLLFSKIEAFV